jgi:ABC-type Zn2+ transport system substrate-binding protein/surface adhesin
MGWLPSFSLMSIIAERLTRRSKQRGKVEVTEDDRDFLARLYCLAAEQEVDASDEDEDHDNDDNGDDYDHDDDDYDDDEDKENDAANWCWNVVSIPRQSRGL